MEWDERHQVLEERAVMTPEPEIDPESGDKVAADSTVSWCQSVDRPESAGGQGHRQTGDTQNRLRAGPNGARCGSVESAADDHHWHRARARRPAVAQGGDPAEPGPPPLSAGRLHRTPAA